MLWWTSARAPFDCFAEADGRVVICCWEESRVRRLSRMHRTADDAEDYEEEDEVLDQCFVLRLPESVAEALRLKMKQLDRAKRSARDQNHKRVGGCAKIIP